MLILVLRNVQSLCLMHFVRSLHLVYPVYSVLLLRPLSLVQQLPVHLLPPITLTSYLPYIFKHCSFKNLPFVIYHSSFVLCHSSFLRLSVTTFPLFRHTPSYCLWPKAYHLFPFLSHQNPVFNIFYVVVSQYKSTTYIPFLYQSSKIRISFL